MITVWLLLQETYEDGDTPDLVDIFDSEELAKVCDSSFTTKEKQLTSHCKNPEGHSGYHGDGRAVWGVSE